MKLEWVIKKNTFDDNVWVLMLVLDASEILMQRSFKNHDQAYKFANAINNAEIIILKN